MSDFKMSEIALDAHCSALANSKDKQFLSMLKNSATRSALQRGVFDITKIHAREVLDSRGNPTVEVDVFVGEIVGKGIAPSGASKGKHEALELRDNSKRYFGLGVQKAVNNVNNILSKKLAGMDAGKQEEIDNLMIKLDGTENKSRLGANAIASVSMACARAAAICRKIGLYSHIGSLYGNKKFCMPTPFMVAIEGGLHAGTKLKFQELMLVPFEKDFKESLRAGSEAYHVLKEIISKKYGKTATNVGYEGAFTPNVSKVREVLEILVRAIEQAGYKNTKIAIDVAASYFYKNGKYVVDGKLYTTEKFTDFYELIAENYPLVSIEDPFQQEDFEAFAELKGRMGKKVQIVGDDLLVTNIERIQKAIEHNSCNCLLLKVNQIGTLTETLGAARLAMKNNWKVMPSHRGGETEDSFLADLAVGINCGQIKAGAPCRSERLAKYNQLLRIEEELGD